MTTQQLLVILKKLHGLSSGEVMQLYNYLASFSGSVDKLLFVIKKLHGLSSSDAMKLYTYIEACGEGTAGSSEDLLLIIKKLHGLNSVEKMQLYLYLLSLQGGGDEPYFNFTQPSIIVSSSANVVTQNVRSNTDWTLV